MAFLDFSSKFDSINVNDYGCLNVAYIGDAVWELYLRSTFFIEERDLDKYNKKVKEYVNAKKQSEIYLSLSDELDEAEKNFSKRARNTKIKSSAKSCSIAEYRNATAFEALIAYYFINNRQDKIEEILKKYILEGGNYEK